MKKVLLSVIVILCLFSACGKKQEAPTPKVVTKVTVTTPDGATQEYTDPIKIRHMLTYLRSLDPGSRPAAVPEKAEEDYLITLHRSDSSAITYRQRGNRYLQKGEEPWRVINRDKAAKLELLLKAMSGDG